MARRSDIRLSCREESAQTAENAVEIALDAGSGDIPRSSGQLS
jgi:hypothetical protein